MLKSKDYNFVYMSKSKDHNCKLALSHEKQTAQSEVKQPVNSSLNPFILRIYGIFKNANLCILETQGELLNMDKIISSLCGEIYP